jgi:hypothetical protein
VWWCGFDQLQEARRLRPLRSGLYVFSCLYFVFSMAVVLLRESVKVIVRDPSRTGVGRGLVEGVGDPPANEAPIAQPFGPN